VERKRGRICRVRHSKGTLAILAALSASIAFADDFKTVAGKEYKNAKVSRVEPNGIVITFSGGIVKLPFTELPADVQKKYGYNSSAAAEYSAEEYEKQNALAQQRKADEQRRFEERQKYLSERPAPSPPSGQPRTEATAHGTTLDQHRTEATAHGTMLDQHRTEATAHGTMLDDRPIGPQIFVYGTVLQVFDDGMLISARKSNAIGTEVIQKYASIFVVGKFQGFYGEDKVQVVGRLAGTYDYQTTYNALRNARMVVRAQVTKLTDFPSGVR
jgi:hypothetical protein